MRATRLGAVVAAVGLAVPAMAIIQQAAPGAANGNGTTSWRGVGLLTVNLGGGNSAICTGTLIAPDCILTAAHCLYDSNNNFVGNNAITASFPGDIAGNFASMTVTPHPNYNAATGTVGGFDIAVIKLANPIPNPVYSGANQNIWQPNWGNITENTGGLTAHIAGYGIGGGGAQGGHGANFPAGAVKRTGTNMVDIVATQAIASGTHTIAAGIRETSVSNPNVPAPGTTPLIPNSYGIPASTLVFDFDSVAAGTNGPLGGAASGTLESNTARGDSGGPMFQFDFTNNIWRIVGVTSYGFDIGSYDQNGTQAFNGAGAVINAGNLADDFFNHESQFGDISVDTRVANYAAFISGCIPSPGSASLLALGGVVALRRRR